MKTIVTFRNDDVRDKLDQSLIDLTNVFIEYKIPITLAVEPANVTKEVADWVLDMKNKHPEIIEIMQHGFDHSKKNKIEKGEFGGQRGFEEQYKEVCRGKELMNENFGDNWFSAINFPYGVYNPSAMQAVDKCGYKVVNSHFNSHWTRRAFYKLGHILGKGFMFNKHISWHLDKYPGTDLFEIDINVSFIKKYVDEDTTCEFFTLEELKEKTKTYLGNPTAGILFHHRYHNTPDKIKLVKDYLDWIKTQNVEFMTSEDIFKKFSGNGAV